MSLTLSELDPAAAAYLIVVAAVLGACLGSFMNCLAWRSVNGESIMRGRSHCTECGHTLGIIDLIPVFSWLLCKGRCRYCKKRVSARYIVVEIVLALVFVLIVIVYGISIQSLAYAALACVLCGVTLVDLDSYTIPNGFVIAGVVVWVLSVWFMQVPNVGFGPGTLFAGALGYGFAAVLVDGLVGAFAVGGGLLLFSLLFDKLTGRQSLGGGDVKLLFVVGLFLGLLGGLLNLLLSCVLGLVFAFVQAFLRHRPSDQEQGSEGGTKESIRTRAFPFGPAISVATMVTLLVGWPMLTWYFELFI